MDWNSNQYQINRRGMNVEHMEEDKWMIYGFIVSEYQMEGL